MKKYIFIIIFLLLIIISMLLYMYNFLPHKKYSNEDFNIDTYISSTDKDGDSIDDQTDILNNARYYISLKPVYKSKYYSTGYPNDKYGVCTDVVGYALKNAGYDLQELVNEDILSNKDKYDISNVDKNIDFRRVKNLIVYFKNNYESLTTNPKDISSWQGGDIVIFKKHIGIVSDKRNKNGVPFVIHHYSKYQVYYEEDILEMRNDIVGHYRIS